jgi:hypothetical protein
MDKLQEILERIKLLPKLNNKSVKKPDSYKSVNSSSIQIIYKKN